MTYTHLLGTLAVTSWFFNVEENSVNNASNIFFTAKFKSFLGSRKLFHDYARGFFISDNVFGYDDPTYIPSPVRELSLLSQFSGTTTL